MYPTCVSSKLCEFIWKASEVLLHAILMFKDILHVNILLKLLTEFLEPLEATTTISAGEKYDKKFFDV